MHYPKGPLIIRFAILISALLLHGCGGGGDSSETSKQPLPETVSPSTPDLSTGVLLDSAVSGIQYITTSGTTGITNSTGEYKYQDGDNITFSFAGITLPAVAAKKVLTPFDLVGSNNINDPSVINLIRLLQSLDDDGVFESKIILSSKKIVLLEKAKLNYKDLTMNIDEFEQLIISKKIFDDSQNTFVSSIAAVAHFKNTLDHSELIDTDQDGISNKSDLDDDNDGVEDTADLFQWDKNESSDFDFDYIGDNQDSDDDNDGIKDALDDQLKLLIKNITSVITDTVRNKAYITDKSAKRLYVVNLDNGLTEKQFQFTFMPERMTLSTDGNQLYVALLVQEHSSYTWEEDQSGYIATFDLTQQTQTNLFKVPAAPYDLVVNQHGKLIISSGSGQWTNIYALDVEDGTVLGTAMIRQASRLTLHPSGDYVFAADTDSSPSDFEKFDISGTGILSLGDSPYHGDYSISGNVWATPDGQYIISRGGNIFLASDMTYVNKLNNISEPIQDIVFDVNNGLAFITTDNGSLEYFNLASLQHIGQLSADGTQHMLLSADKIVVMTQSQDSTLNLDSLAHPCLDCNSNVPPIADFSYTYAADGTTFDTFEFDASASSDAEDNTSLQYRWDFNNDNAWDTDFTTTSVYKQQFLIAGTKQVTLQVKDAAGLVNSKTLSIDIAQGIDSGSEVDNSNAYQLQFSVTDVITDTTRNKAYITDKSAKRLYVVNLDNGLTEKQFQFTFMPERMTLSADGNQLYVALLVQEHSSYTWEEEQSGYIATFDLTQQTQTNLFKVPADPYDLVVNQHGKLIVSSGSGQWTNIYALDVEDGTVLGTAMIRQASRLTLHPSGDYVFAADTDSSPSDFEKFDISGTGILSLGDSPYHGDYSIGGNVWATPDGQYIISRGGNIFLASDMTYVNKLNNISEPIQDIVFDESNMQFYVLAEENITLFKSDTFEVINTISSPSSSRLLLTAEQVFTINTSSPSIQQVTLSL